jgi:hypothetical protein
MTTTTSVRLTITTWLAYLFGSRRAIESIMLSRQALWLGGAFVISAGLAREYDGEDLLREPWYVLIPAVVSTVTASLLFLLLGLVASKREVLSALGAPLRFGLSYRGLLTLYWLMAPMAWLYAIPVERFLSPADAVRTNLSLLAIVSLWRVLLMTRIVAIIFQRSFFAALFPVMLFADAVAFVASRVSPTPIFDFMAGVRLSEAENIVLDTTVLVSVVGVVSFPVWLIGTIVTAFTQKSPAPNEVPNVVGQTSCSSSFVCVALISVIVWIGVLPFTQPEQWNRRQVERLMRSGKIDQALEFMSSRTRSDFPPHWDYPPRIGYGQRKPSLTDVVLATRNDRVAPWVQRIYQDKFTYYNSAAPHHHSVRPMPFRPRDMTEQELERFVDLLRSLPNGREIAANHGESIHAELERGDDLSPRNRELLITIYELSGKKYESEDDSPEPQ